MRACEGCRRRKIKCDAATTNTWPCSACIRLKLHCVPPTVNYDREFAPDSQGFDQSETGAGTAGEQYQQQMSIQHQMATSQRNVPPIYNQQVGYSDTMNVYQSGSYGDGTAGGNTQNAVHYNTIQHPTNVVNQNQHYTHQQLYDTHSLPQPNTESSPSQTYEQDQYGQQNLADLLGELKVDETGTGKLNVGRLVIFF